MRCPNCGETLPDGSNECPKCGAEFEISFKSVPAGAASGSDNGNENAGEPIAPAEPTTSQKEPGKSSGGAEDDNHGRTSSEKPSPKWYASTWFTVLMCFLLPPVGIVLAWKFKKPSGEGFRVVLTMLAVLLIIIGISVPFYEADTKATGATVEYNGIRYVEPNGWDKGTTDDGDTVYTLNGSDPSKAKAKIYLFANDTKPRTKSDLADLAAESQTHVYQQQTDPHVTNTRELDSIDGAILLASDYTAQSDDGYSFSGKLTVVSMADGQIWAMYCCFDGDDSTESAYDSLIASIKMTDDEKSAIAALPDSSSSSSSSSSNGSASNSSSASSSSSSSASTSSSSSSSSKKYSAGTYRVGKDIPAGEYNLTATGSGYFCVYPDSSKSDILENDNFTKMDYITVSDGQYLVIDDATATPMENYSGKNASSVSGDGKYLVGVDIPAGEYKLSSSASSSRGYYCIYNSSKPGAEIVQNNNFTESDYCTVSEGQYLVVDRCTATLQ